MEHLSSPNSGEDLRSNAHQSQIIGEDADEDHTKFIGGDTVKLLGGIYPPRVAAPLVACLTTVLYCILFRKVTVSQNRSSC